MKITVTEDDWKGGRPCDSYCCAVATAIMRVTGKKVKVSPSQSSITGPTVAIFDGSATKKVPLSPAANRLALRYDENPAHTRFGPGWKTPADLGVELPLTFELDI